jgi:MFS family permease
MKLSLRRTSPDGAAAIAQTGQRSSIPPLIKRNTVYFAFAQAFQGAGMQLMIALGPPMVLRLLNNVALSGIAGSILGVSRILVAYPMGKVTDTYGRKLGMVFGLLLGLAGALTLGASMLLSSFVVFVAGLIILGLGVGAAQQLRVAAADMYPPLRRAEGLGYVLTGSVVGAFVGPVIISGGEMIAARFEADAIAVSWALVPLAIIPAIVLILLVRPDPKTIAANLAHYWPGYQPPVRAAGQAIAAPAGGFRAFVRERPKQVAYACYAAAQGTMAMMMAMTPLVLTLRGYDFTAISLAVSLHVIGMFAFSIYMGKLTDRFGRKPLLGIGLVVAASGALLVPVTPYYPVITLGLFLVGLGWSAANVASTALIADTTSPQERGRAIGAADSLAASLAIGMPLIGGVMVDLWGLLAVGVLGAALALSPFLVYGRLRESSPGRYEEAGISSARS